MKMSSQEQQTVSFYENNAERWAASYSLEEKSFWHEELEMFKKYLPAGKVLEIGFGGGREAAQLIKMGYDYTGIDPAVSLVDIIKNRLPHGTFLAKSVYDMDFPSQSFDGFWCAAVVLHVPHKRIDYVLQTIKGAMKPEAIGFISLAEGKGKYFDEETQRWFYLYGLDEFSEILHKNGFKIEKSAVRKREKSNQPWLQSWATFFVRV